MSGDRRINEAREAKAALLALMKYAAATSQGAAVGITGHGSGYAIKVNTEGPVPPGLPSSVNGVVVLYEQVGTVVPR